MAERPSPPDIRGNQLASQHESWGKLQATALVRELEAIRKADQTRGAQKLVHRAGARWAKGVGRFAERRQMKIENKQLHRAQPEAISQTLQRETAPAAPAEVSNATQTASTANVEATTQPLAERGRDGTSRTERDQHIEAAANAADTAEVDQLLRDISSSWDQDGTAHAMEASDRGTRADSARDVIASLPDDHAAPDASRTADGPPEPSGSPHAPSESSTSPDRGASPVVQAELSSDTSPTRPDTTVEQAAYQAARMAAYEEGAANFRAKADEERRSGNKFMEETYSKQARRMGMATALAFDMAHNPDLARSIDPRGHLNRPDQGQATVELMATVGLPDLQKAWTAEASGDTTQAATLKSRAQSRMGDAAYRADFGVDASRMVKHRPQSKRWKFFAR